MKRGIARRERGMALLLLLAVVALGSSWYLVSRLNADSNLRTATVREQNAKTLNRAKQALIAYVATQAAKDGENNPGSLPCPENPGDFNSATGNDGKTGSGCGTSLKVGRFPWRTIGTDKLVDAYGEPLWYVVSTNWGVPTGGNSVINSNSAGQLTVDNVANDAVALIIAPGPAITVAASTNCVAWTQTRATTGTPDWRNYLECENATNPADSTFVTTGPSGSYNDQVMKVTAAELLPSIEAAIAQRMEREIVPVLNTVYTPTLWGFAGSNPVYPFAAPFANPGPGSGTSPFQGVPVVNLNQGLLPFNQTQGCTAGASNPRCLTSLLSFAALPDASKTAGSGSMTYENCVYEPSISAAGCTIQISTGTATIAMTAVINNVAMGLRSLNLAGTELWQYNSVTGIYSLISGQSLSATLSSNGAATMRVQTPSLTVSTYYYIRLYLTAAGDHTLLDATTTGSGATGWFARNEWYRLLYYATAYGYTAASLTTPPTTAPSCTTLGNCLSVANGDPAHPITPVGGQRAILILAGRSINGSARPSPTRSDYLELGNATAAYERRTVRASNATAQAQRFNDRIVVIGSN